MVDQIDDLNDSLICLKKPIIVLVHCDTEDVTPNCIARFYGANISASGESVSGATENLIDVITLKFKTLRSFKSADLGTEPKRQLAILNSFIMEK